MRDRGKIYLVLPDSGESVEIGNGTYDMMTQTIDGVPNK